MNSDTVLRIAVLGILLACTETLHGMVRIRFLIPRLGRERAVKLSAATGTALAFGVCMVVVPGIGLQGVREHLLLGLGLAGFMAGFDLAIGRWLMRKPWGRIWPDFNPATGNYLLYGLIALAVIPLVVGYLRDGLR